MIFVQIKGLKKILTVLYRLCCCCCSLIKLFHIFGPPCSSLATREKKTYLVVRCRPFSVLFAPFPSDNHFAISVHLKHSPLPPPFSRKETVWWFPLGLIDWGRRRLSTVSYLPRTGAELCCGLDRRIFRSVRMNIHSFTRRARRKRGNPEPRFRRVSGAGSGRSACDKYALLRPINDK